jgi:hypothetical protein
MSALVRSAREALDAQVVAAQQYASPSGERAAKSWVEAVKTSGFADWTVTGERFARHHIEMFRSAPTLWVAAEVRDLVTSAAQTLGCERVRHDDPPAATGVIWIEGGANYWALNEQEREEVAQRLDATKDLDEIDVASVEADVLAERLDVIRATLDDLRALLPDTGFSLAAVLWKVTPTGVVVSGVVPIVDTDRWDFPLPDYLVVDYWSWTFDAEWDEAAEDLDDKFLHFGANAALVSKAVGNTRRWLLALWRFMGQEIVVSEPAFLDRAARRRAERAGQDASVTVVRLRRVQHPDAPDTDRIGGRLWTMRWWVSGHWRTLYRGTDRERKIWVRPFVKGPDDKPLAAPKRRLVSIER